MHTGFDTGLSQAAGVVVSRGRERLNHCRRRQDGLAFSSSPLVGGLWVVDADRTCVPGFVRGFDTERSVVPVDAGAPLVEEGGSMRDHLLTMRGVEG